MAKKYMLIKGDFHLHTLYSDNMDKMDVSDYDKLAKKYGLDVLCITDHHHNLTQNTWEELSLKIKNHVGLPLIMQGYEITFAKGHIVLLNKSIFDSEYIKDAIKNLYNDNNLRIMAHPDNNNCKWQINLVPGIDGIEILNSGHDALSYKEDSICNGIKTYKAYLLLRHKLAAFANTDCHYSFTFGKAWTGVFIPQNKELNTETAINAIKSGHTYSCAGDLLIELYSEDYIMGDTLISSGDKYIYWKCPQNSDVILYYGDTPLDAFKGSEGSFKPMMNGPYWIFVKNGNAWAASSPIWVSGIKDRMGNHDVRNNLLENGLIYKNNERVKHYFSIIERLISDYKFNDNYIDAYIKWFKQFIIENINDEELANKSTDFLFYENTKRLQLIEKILMMLINELLLKIGSEEISKNHLTLYNFDNKEYDGVIQTEILISPDTKDFYLTDDNGNKINFVSMVMKDNTFINQERSPERMKEVALWLKRGEMH